MRQQWNNGCPVIDLNELSLYAKVVEYGGFAPTSRALGIPKSTLSRRINQLETRLGVRLIQRSTRQFQVSEIGQAYYRHCVAMLAEAESAEDLIEQNRAEPRGVIRLCCTTALLHFWTAPLLAKFMALNPAIELYVKTYNRRVDIISEGYDLALNLCFPPLEDSELVMKVLSKSPQVLVASPRLLDTVPKLELPADLSALPSLAWSTAQSHYSWHLTGCQGQSAQVSHYPKLVSDDVGLLKNAVLQGVGIAALPLKAVEQELSDGSLLGLLEHWQPQEGVITAVFPSRRGLLPSIRSLIDFLASEFSTQPQPLK
ncbi:LysR substrate-binding domain-containing protein [Pseudomonas sp. 5P_3.1_Bac2]|uniref:LysR substrate-binding domain-containing protein n=1 Tax=Pseudomonas sp. 5P_3.1_Bac2 TaxID=2971617 RepID=UPI003965A781